jgi:hypothetical protein
VAIDPAGDLYVVGTTSSSEQSFPVATGPDLTFNGGTDAFVARVSADGQVLAACGYLGGAGDDRGLAVAVGASRGPVVVGSTTSSEATFPVAVGPDLTRNGGVDGFVAEIAAATAGVVSCGYVGGAERDEVRAVALDARGVAYVAGTTRSSESSFPVRGALDLAHNGGADAFVAAVDRNGAELILCGYVGGSEADEGNAIAVDPSGNVLLGGWAMSTEATFPVRGGPVLTHATSYDGFVANLGALGAEARFGLVAEPAALSVAPGTKLALSVRVERNGVDGPIRIAAESVPPGVRLKPRSRDVAGDVATFTIKVKRSATPGSYVLRLAGTDAAGTRAPLAIPLVVESRAKRRTREDTE